MITLDTRTSFRKCETLVGSASDGGMSECWEWSDDQKSVLFPRPLRRLILTRTRIAPVLVMCRSRWICCLAQLMPAAAKFGSDLGCRTRCQLPRCSTWFKPVVLHC